MDQLIRQPLDRVQVLVPEMCQGVQYDPWQATLWQGRPVVISEPRIHATSGSVTVHSRVATPRTRCFADPDEIFHRRRQAIATRCGFHRTA